MKVIFSADTGITIDNAPAELVSMCSRWNMINGSLQLTTDFSSERAMNVLTMAGFVNVTNLDGDIHVIPNRIEAGTVAGIIGNTRPAVEAAFADFIAPAPTPNRDQEDRDLEDGEGEEEEEEEEEEFHVPTFEMNEITSEELLRRLPVLVEPEDASRIKLCTDKIREYDRIWGQAITLKRQIDGMMTEIDRLEVLQKLSSDLEYLGGKCEDVDDIKIGIDSLLVITTKEIMTEAQPRYGSRLLGRMRVSIDLRYVYPKAAPSSNYANAIQIHNLDRNPYSGGSYWSCGHVRNTPGEGQGICWGGYYQQLFDAFVAKDITQLFDTVMRFIKNPYESDEWGCRIRFFPEVTVNEA